MTIKTARHKTRYINMRLQKLTLMLSVSLFDLIPRLSCNRNTVLDFVHSLIVM